MKSESEVAQSYLTLCDPMDCSLPCSSLHGIFQARVLEQVAISFSRGSSQPRDRTWVSHIVGRRFTVWATREVSALVLYILFFKEVAKNVCGGPLYLYAVSSMVVSYITAVVQLTNLIPVSPVLYILIYVYVYLVLYILSYL